MKLKIIEKIPRFTAQGINCPTELVAHVAQQMQRLCF